MVVETLSQSTWFADGPFIHIMNDPEALLLSSPSPLSGSVAAIFHISTNCSHHHIVVAFFFSSPSPLLFFPPLFALLNNSKPRPRLRRLALSTRSSTHPLPKTRRFLSTPSRNSPSLRSAPSSLSAASSRGTVSPTFPFLPSWIGSLPRALPFPSTPSTPAVFWSR